MVTARCLSEKKNVEVKNPVYSINKIGRVRVMGTCPSCGKKVQQLVKAADAPPEIKAKLAAKKGGAKSRQSRKSRGSRKSRK